MNQYLIFSSIYNINNNENPLAGIIVWGGAFILWLIFEFIIVKFKKPNDINFNTEFGYNKFYSTQVYKKR